MTVVRVTGDGQPRIRLKLASQAPELRMRLARPPVMRLKFASGMRGPIGPMDTTVATDLATETSVRAAADLTLQSNINAEAAARAAADTVLGAADTTLQTNITNEATARASADTTLQTNIDAKAAKTGDTFTGPVVIDENDPRLRWYDANGTVNKRKGTIGYYADRLSVLALNDSLAIVRTIVEMLHDGGLKLIPWATAGRPAGEEGIIGYNSDTDRFEGYANGAWGNIGPTPFTASFESAEQSITSAGSLTLAHSLGAVPKFIQTHLICKTAEHNFSINDRVLVNPVDYDAAGSGGASITFDATNINVRFTSLANPYTVLNKTTGAAATLTNASWRLIVRAWA